MSRYPNHLGAARKQRLRVRLAERDGGPRCFYCWSSFDDLDLSATFDHFAPRRLLPVCKSWVLVLACYPCNQAKGDSLPRGLVLALLNMIQSRPMEAA